MREGRREQAGRRGAGQVVGAPEARRGGERERDRVPELIARGTVGWGSKREPRTSRMRRVLMEPSGMAAVSDQEPQLEVEERKGEGKSGAASFHPQFQDRLEEKSEEKQGGRMVGTLRTVLYLLHNEGDEIKPLQHLSLPPPNKK